MNCLAQDADRFFFASRHCRDSVNKALIEMVENTIHLPLSNEYAKKWTGACWAMELMLYRPKVFEAKIPTHLLQLPKLNNTLQYAYLEMLYTPYPYQFQKHVTALLKKIEHEKVKAIAWEYVVRGRNTNGWKKDVGLKNSTYYSAFLYQRSKEKTKLPSIEDFIDPSFLPGEAVLCSFQYANRNQSGFLMIRKADGNWLSNEQGVAMKFPQLARSITNLPSYLTNGNTPQGLYMITGTDRSENPWIGPTINLQLIMPFENGNKTFFGTDTAYDHHYQQLLGDKLKHFQGLYESFTSGKLGRTEIIAHGTTIDPNLYASQPFYPFTPSLGCLCSPEQWNDDGIRIKSIQQEWMLQMQSMEKKPRYLIVAEISATATQ
ncbi:MAG: hypothetical protein ACO3BD_00840 [Chitinophagaceae bacterium]